MSQHQVDQPRPPDLGTFVLEDDEQVGRDGHDFPARQERHGCPGGHDTGERGEHNSEQQVSGSHTAIGSLRLEVADPVDGDDRTDAKNDDDKPARQRIHSERR